MNRGGGRRPIFLSAAHQGSFLELIAEVTAIFGIEIHAYCLLSNHYHLLVRTPAAGLGRAMRHLDGVHAQRVNRAARTDGALFRGRYRAILIEKDVYFCQVSRYIHLNPLAAGIVVRPEDHRASSYRAYLGLEPCPDWLRTRETLDRFGPADARDGYRRFVEAGIDEETKRFYDEGSARPVLGSETFKRRVQEAAEAAGVGQDAEVPDRLRILERPAMQEIADSVCKAFEIPPSVLRSGSPAAQGYGLARGALVLLAREAGGHRLDTIAQWMGYRSYAAAAKAMERLKNRSRRDVALQERLDGARGWLAGAAGAEKGSGLDLRHR
jgi:REP element-mobilizing transposase RayT